MVARGALVKRISGVEYGDGRLSQLFWDKVYPEPNTGCWLWGAKVNPKGYGQIHIGGRSGGPKQAHRHLVESIGYSINGHHVLHTCDVPSCVNPEHLRIGTNDDNVADRVRKRRSSGKLTEGQVLDIRRRIASGEVHRMVALDYGITRSAVSMVGSRVIYKWVA